ncbi:MAG: hypothetical protein J7L32_05330 [Thermoplasmata archaeon]|nr:hypothetical protein [Thermoplasmata archaeon]
MNDIDRILYENIMAHPESSCMGCMYDGHITGNGQPCSHPDSWKKEFWEKRNGSEDCFQIAPNYTGFAYNPVYREWCRYEDGLIVEMPDGEDVFKALLSKEVKP